MSEVINQILKHTDMFMGGLVGLCVLGGIIIEASPIPIKPLKWLGNRLNQDIKKDIVSIQNSVDGLDKRLTKMEDDALKSDLQAKRSIVLNFADKLRRTPYDQLGKICTLEDFVSVIEIIDEYTVIILDKKIPNGKFDSAREYINDMFYTLSKEGAFVDK